MKNENAAAINQNVIPTDVLIVGGGIAGLTAAAYLCSEKFHVILCEKEDKVGGLAGSFEYKGFIFDSGIRAVENSGILFPMLKQLGITVEFLPNPVSIGLENDLIQVLSTQSLQDYRDLLLRKFPESRNDIDKILEEIHKIMQYMDILYGIDNPAFLNLRENTDYLLHTLLPWFFKFIVTIGKINRLQKPVDEYLTEFTRNQKLIDFISQHFFKKTPAFFALSYFSLYLDYKYPKGGTGSLIHKMEDFILRNKGEIRKSAKIMRIDPQSRLAYDDKGNCYHYKKLIWTADTKSLYRILDLIPLNSKKVKNKIIETKALMENKTGNDSILTTYLTLDMDKSYFENKCTAHFFYTPRNEGLSHCPLTDLFVSDPEKNAPVYTDEKQKIIDWIRRYYTLTTYEISCPVMRDPDLAPVGKTGLIVSALMEYSLVKHIHEMGWYEEFKTISQDCMIDILDETIFPGIKTHKMDSFVSTPLTIQRLTDNTDGAITGWSFTNSCIPAVSSFTKVKTSIKTPIPNVYQAGQWTYSPSGFPISVMTGKFASDEVKKELKTHQ